MCWEVVNLEKQISENTSESISGRLVFQNFWGREIRTDPIFRRKVFSGGGGFLFLCDNARQSRYFGMQIHV